MKNFIAICFAALISQAAFAQQSATSPAANENQKTGTVKKIATKAALLQTTQFQVWGNCGMCKKTIEKAAKSVAGVENADWNKDTHQFTAQFDAVKTSSEKIQQAIAATGYDTEKVRGDDAAYNDLPGCCQYERPK